MTYRINKKQAQMLIDGKFLKIKNKKIAVGNEDVRKLLMRWVASGCKTPLFIEEDIVGYKIIPGGLINELNSGRNN